jgi:hypothetical protein
VGTPVFLPQFCILLINHFFFFFFFFLVKDPATIPKVAQPPQNGTAAPKQEEIIQDEHGIKIIGGGKPPNFPNLDDITKKAKDMVRVLYFYFLN